MPNIWSSLFRGSQQPEKRMNQNDWAQQYLNFQNHSYPLMGGGSNRMSSAETIENDFTGYVQGAFKSDGVVFACMVARQFLFSQARFQWQKIREGRPTDLFGTTELEILEKPWANGSTGALLSRGLQHADIGGNHYAYRDPTSKRIRVLRPDWVDIILTAPPHEAMECDVAGHVFKPGGTDDPSKWKFFVAGDDRFAHWAPIPDPEAQYRGMSWMTPVMREIMSDKAATIHKSKFFENGATPNLAVSFKETVSADQFRQFMDTMNEEKGGLDHAYETLYLGGGADVTVVGKDLRQMDFKATQGAGETRIAAAARIHPVIVGLSEGMQGSSLNAGNFKTAKDAFGDGTMRPLWESLCSSYESLVKVPERARLWYDDRDIAFLRDDLLQQSEVQTQEATMIARCVQDGFTPESSIEAVMKKDWTLLKHTGLFSVQLQPPFPEGVDAHKAKLNPDSNGDNPAGGGYPGAPKPGASKPGAGAAKKPADEKKPTDEKGKGTPKPAPPGGTPSKKPTT